MRSLKIFLQLLFFLVLLALFLSRGAVAGFSHDENQFVAPGQLLIRHGLLPYADYPYTHMPYAILPYALSAALSSYDFLAARALNALAWFGCALLIVLGFRDGREEQSSWEWLWALVVAFVFFSGQILNHIDGNALNHSFATLFGLLALPFFMRSVRRGQGLRWSAFAAGACAAIAGLMRFNFAVVLVILGGLLVVQRILPARTGDWRPVVTYAGGAFAAALPALALLARAPLGFVYTNYVYIRLNTIYYEGQLYRVNMQLGQKLLDFLLYLRATPVDLILYLLMLVVLVRSLIRWLQRREPAQLNEFALAACSLALAATAFAPSPTQPQYFLAAIPFLSVILYRMGLEVMDRSPRILALSGAILVVLLVATERVPNPVAQLRALTRPLEWVPVQAHDLSASLREYVPEGRVLSLLPMFPLEAGYEVYPFAANGPFSWRTSLLLTPARRREYGVTSPEELPGLLKKDPPAAILTGFEATNAGFQRSDMGGLETPFVDYARLNGFRSVPLSAPFLDQPITLWLRQP